MFFKKSIFTKLLFEISAICLILLCLTISKHTIIFYGALLLVFTYLVFSQDLFSFLKKKHNYHYYAISIILLISLLVRFNNIWNKSDTVINIFKMLNLNHRLMIFVISLFLLLLAIPFLEYIVEVLIEKITKKKLKYDLTNISDKQTFVILFLLYLVALFPLFRANFFYYDDFSRAHRGYSEWGSFSRYISDFLSGFVHGDSFLADISPWAQIIAIVIIVLASMILIKTIKNEERFSFGDLLAVIPLGLSPYFLECISYKYDSPYMALSILVSVLPFIFYKKGKIVYAISIFISMLLMCTTYQAASGIFPMIVAAMSLVKYLEKESYKDILEFIGISALSYILAIVFFKVFLMIPFDGYVSNSVTTNLSEIFANYQSYFLTFNSDFKVSWKIIISLIIIWFIISGVIASKRNKVLSLLVIMIMLIFMILLSVGLYPFLKITSLEPRSMYGIGAFIAIISLCNFRTIKENFTNVLICFVCSYLFFVFAMTYGNALNMQKEYANYRISEVVDYLSRCEEFRQVSDDKKVIRTFGTIGHVSAIENMSYDFNMLKRLVPTNFYKSPWGSYQLTYYYGLDKIAESDNYKLFESYDDFTLLDENFYHEIYYKDNYFAIVLK